MTDTKLSTKDLRPQSEQKSKSDREREREILIKQTVRQEGLTFLYY
jgi:hypothetical protein